MKSGLTRPHEGCAPAIKGGLNEAASAFAACRTGYR